MGSTVHVTIKSAEIAQNEIEKLCQNFEKVDRDSETGEILCGGNTFVDVSYGHGVLAAYRSVINAQVARGRTEFGTISLVELPNEHKTLQMWDNAADKPSYKVDSDDCGGLVARVLAARGELGCLAETNSPAPTANDTTAPKADLSVSDPNFFLC
jgi:hypothetical protein